MNINIKRITNKAPILISGKDKELGNRYVEMGENDAGYLLLLEGAYGDHPAPVDWMAFSPEEMAQIMASTSGRWRERFNAELDRIYGGTSDAAH